jgi:hypothetical protein
MFTMFYAVVGVPLMLLWVSNIGNLMAKTFKFAYFHGPCCPGRQTSSSTNAHNSSSTRKSVQPSNRQKRGSSKEKGSLKGPSSPSSSSKSGEGGLSTTVQYSLGEEKYETRIGDGVLERSLSSRSSGRSLRELEAGAKQVLLECAEYNMASAGGGDERSRRVLQQLSHSPGTIDEEAEEETSEVESVIEVRPTHSLQPHDEVDRAPQVRFY